MPRSTDVHCCRDIFHVAAHVFCVQQFGLADAALNGRDGGAGNLELLNPTVYKKRTPAEYDTRSFKVKKVEKSGKINPKDASTW